MTAFLTVYVSSALTPALTPMLTSAVTAASAGDGEHVRGEDSVAASLSALPSDSLTSWSEASSYVTLVPATLAALSWDTVSPLALLPLSMSLSLSTTRLVSV